MTTPPAATLQRLVQAVRTLNEETTTSMAATLIALGPTATAEQAHAAISMLPNPGARGELAALVREWQEVAPGTPLSSLGWALLGAASAGRSASERECLELAWTGPAPHWSTLRRIDQALLDLVDGARRSLLIVTFVAYRIPHLADALLRAAERGVDIAFVQESAEESGGKAAFLASGALPPALATRAQLWLWPLDQRQKDDRGRHGSLHVKCAIADDDVLLVSSANLTEFAFNLNMELGLLVRGGDAPPAVARHVRELMVLGVLQRATAPP